MHYVTRSTLGKKDVMKVASAKRDRSQCQTEIPQRDVIIAADRQQINDDCKQPARYYVGEYARLG